MPDRIPMLCCGRKGRGRTGCSAFSLQHTRSGSTAAPATPTSRRGYWGRWLKIRGWRAERARRRWGRSSCGELCPYEPRRGRQLRLWCGPNPVPSLCPRTLSDKEQLAHCPQGAQRDITQRWGGLGSWGTRAGHAGGTGGPACLPRHRQFRRPGGGRRPLRAWRSQPFLPTRYRWRRCDGAARQRSGGGGGAGKGGWGGDWQGEEEGSGGVRGGQED